MAISSVGREVSRFLGYFFDQLKIKNRHQKNIPKFTLTLTVVRGKLSLTKPKFMTYRYMVCGTDLPGAIKVVTRGNTIKGWRGFRAAWAGVRLFNIITLMTDSFDSVVAFAGLFHKVYYVNIAWGCFSWRVFLFRGLGGSLILGFYYNYQISIKSPKTMCRKWVDTKSMTGKTTEGLASGGAKKTGEVLINTFKKSIKYHLLKRLDFCPVGCVGCRIIYHRNDPKGLKHGQLQLHLQ
jgi:hypothetical protein